MNKSWSGNGDQFVRSRGRDTWLTTRVSGEPSPGMLWGGPYPLSVGITPPTVVKTWFNTAANALLVYNTAPNAWVSVSPTVTVGSVMPTTVGALYLDQNGKFWVHVDDLKELADPVIGAGVTPVNGSTVIPSITPPQSPAQGSCWFEPYSQSLSVWNGTAWVKICQAVNRSNRIGSYAVQTWNAGGNRSQGVAAGNLLVLSGIRGILPSTQQQAAGPGPGNSDGTGIGTGIAGGGSVNGNLRINTIYDNIQAIAQAEGLTLFDIYGLDTYTTSAAYQSPTASLQAQPQYWGNGPYPCRTHIFILQLSGSDTISEFPAVPNWPGRGDIVEVTVMFWTGMAGKRWPNGTASEVLAIPGVHKQEF